MLGSRDWTAAAPYRALTIAKWFIAWAEAEDEEISNLKLQKLLYYAQGHHLKEYHRPLFSDTIEAWSHGPVVPDIYHEYKNCGSASITLPEGDPFSWDDVDRTTANLLSRVWNTYGGFSAGRLRAMTHEETPWRKHFRDGVRNVKIPDAEIEQYFVRNRLCQTTEARSPRRPRSRSQFLRPPVTPMARPRSSACTFSIPSST